MTWQRRLGFALLSVGIGCGPGAHTRAGGGVGPLSVHEVAWNPTHAEVGHVRAVAEASGVTAVFSELGATILASGAVVAVDRSGRDWVDAAVVPGADGAAHWILGLSRDGQLYRLKDRSSFEPVSARYGVEGERVRAIAPLGGDLVAFLLTQNLAIANGSTVARYNAPELSNLLGGGGYGVGLVSFGPYVFHASDFHALRYDLPGIRRAALGADGALYAATSRAVYTAAPGGDLSLAFDSQSNGVEQLMPSGDTVWFTDGKELGVVEAGHVRETNAQPVTPETVLSPTATDDIWALANGSLRRFSNVIATPDSDAAWAANIAPIFARACAACHEPNGLAGIDLSAATAWASERTAIRNRVIETQTMPPQGHSLTQADRAAIEAWSRSAP